MNFTWLLTIASVLLTSLVGFVGALTLSLNQATLKRAVFYLVSFSTGALFGDAFIHLLPEAVEAHGFTPFISLSLISGILTFFILEKIICWRHCHIPTSSDHPHPFAWMNLIGDAFHNAIDGMVIAGSYLASPALGITTTIAVLLHEIPQEIGDFGVLVHGGFDRLKALMLNFLAQLAALIGAVLVLGLSIRIEVLTQFLLPFTAGGFIYIAGSDLIPELKRETGLKNSLLQLFSLSLGLLLMLLLLGLE